VDKSLNVPLTIRAQDSASVWALCPPEVKDGMVSCLLIEANRDEGQRVSGLLETLGFDCIVRQTADEGIRYCHESHPDLVMMEASELPSAREFLRLVKYQGQKDGRPKVLLYSDHANLTTMGETILEGASEFLIKPFDTDLLKFKLCQSGVFPAKAA
jgi:two-component system chemotaxis response regulator CheY